jgi:ELWxxDGT repeat protein
VFLKSSLSQVSSGVQSSNRPWATHARVLLSVLLSLGLVASGLSSTMASASAPELSLVKDIYSEVASALDETTAGAIVGSTYFFPANDGINGRELWKSDGTEAGTVLVKDIRTGSSSSSPGRLTAVGNILYFTAYDNVNGRELWKSDGTEAGTVLVKDIRTGRDEEEDEPLDGNLDELIAVGSTLYFSANDGTHGDELWKSNGTSETTVRVKDIYTGDCGGSPCSGNPDNMSAVGNTLYFTANTLLEGDELWKSDGTEAGTVLVMDIRLGSSGIDPNKLTAVGNTLYFSANTASGRELWKSSGTSETTVRVKDISPSNLTAVGNTLFFTAHEDVNGTELWKSSGTSETTVRVKDIATGDCGGSPCSSEPGYLTSVGNTLYFSAFEEVNGGELWKSDGTEVGTVIVKDIWVGSDNGSYPRNLTAVGSTLYFSADDGTNRRELWKSDGTGVGTSMVENINPTPGSGSHPMFFSASDSTLFFRADDGTVGIELWKLTIASATDSSPPTSSGSGYVAPVVVPKVVPVVPSTIRQTTIRKATEDKPARLLGRSLDKDVLFIADSARLSPEVKKSLRQAARLAKASDGKVAVTGFAAVTGRGSAYEKSVAQKRALAVARYLRAQGFGDWIYYQGLSGRQGLAFEGDPRRVEIRILN